MKKTGIVLVAMLMVLSSCDRKSRVATPETLLSEQQMIEALTDSYLIEAELNQRKSVGEDVTRLQGVYYHQLFEHYGITDSIFEENMTYYSYQLPTLERIMDSVNNRFVQAQGQ